MTSKVAILLPVYRGDNPAALERAVASMEAQTHPATTLYLGVDGPIPESLWQRVNAARDIPVVRVISEQNHGLWSILNRMIDTALADADIDYLARMDADDESLPERLDAQVRRMDADPRLDILGTACIEVHATPNGEQRYRKTPNLEHEDIVRDFTRKGAFIHPTVMFRRRVLADGLRYRGVYPRLEDYDMWVRAMAAGYRFGNLENPLLLFTVAPDTFKRRRGFMMGKWQFELGMQAAKVSRTSRTRAFIHGLGIWFLRTVPATFAAPFYKRFRSHVRAENP